MLSGGGTRLARRRNTMRPQARTAMSLLNNFTYKHILHYIVFQDSTIENKNLLCVCVDINRFDLRSILCGL